jgi:transketolase
MCWSYALKNRKQPTVLLLTRQKLPSLERSKDFDIKSIYKGGYVLLREKNARPDVVLVATGSEVEVAVDAEKILDSQGVSVRIVSLPSLELFKNQPKAYQESVIPASETKVVVIEAGIANGWGRITDLPLLTLGIDRFGASGPYQILAEKFGFTGKQVATKVLNWLNS